MEGSRLSRLGKKSLDTRNHLTLMQDISPNEFDQDRPINNQSTFFFDQNNEIVQAGGKKKQIPQQKQDLDQQENKNASDLYALPAAAILQQEQMERKLLNKNKSNMDGGSVLNKKKYPSEPTRNAMMQSTAKSNKSNLLKIRKPKGFTKYRPIQGTQKDFIGGDLYEVEDIISDISKIMQSSKRRLIEHNPQQAANSYKPKWNNKFTMMSKLDQMLMGYKSTPDNDPIPIMDDFYRKSKRSEMDQSPLQSQRQEKGKEKQVVRNKFGGLGNFRKKNDKNPKLSIIVVKWSEMPIILGQWDTSFYLKLQSYPQNQSYKKLIIKALQAQVKSYSIFYHSDAGVIKIQKSEQNDKNMSNENKRLMSEEQYAKKWQQTLENGEALTQSQKETLMQFDIEWYRTLVEYVYHSGLEDLLEREHDIQEYINMIGSIKRVPKPTTDILAQNQFKYLQQYFSQVYSYATHQLIIGIIKINNDQKAPIQQMRDYFATVIKSQFTLLSLDAEGLQSVILLKYRGNEKQFVFEQNYLSFTHSKAGLTMGVCCQENHCELANKFVLKNDVDNDWQLHMKVMGGEQGRQNMKIRLTQQLLFGVMYSLQGIEAKQ